MKKYLIVLFCFFVFPRFTFSQAGNRDSTFGINGITGAPVQCNNCGVSSMAIQPDGKIVVGGNSSSYHNFFARYSTDGTLDLSFGINGSVEIPIGIGQNTPGGLVLQPDGKILFGGTCEDNSGKWCFQILRLNTNGTLDLSFNGSGFKIISLTNGYDYGSGIALQPDGKILECGQSGFAFSPYDYMSIVRVNSNGSIDNTFGNAGTVFATLGDSIYGANNIIIQPDNKILIIGGRSDLGPPSAFTLLRFNNSGSPDLSFGNNGVDTTYFGCGCNLGVTNYDNSRVGNFSLQTDGKIILTGSYVNSGNGGMATIRYLPNGKVDSSFAINGKIMIPNMIGGAILIQPDSKIIVVAYLYNLSQKAFCLIRYNANGIIDSTFGLNGIVGDSLNAYNTFGVPAALQNDNKIVLGGGIQWVGMSLARYLSGLNVGAPLIPQQNNELLIYPNPNSGEFTVIIANPCHQDNYEIKLFDILGRNILQQQYCTQETECKVETTNISNGIYLLTLYRNGLAVGSKKVLVSKN